MNPISLYTEFISQDDAIRANHVIMNKIITETSAPILPTPLLTASGAIENASLVLFTLRSEYGLEEHSYLFLPNQSFLPSQVHASNAAIEEVKRQSCVPEKLADHFLTKFMLLGGTGILSIAIASIDIAARDMLALVIEKPYYHILSSSIQNIPCYKGSGSSIESEEAVFIKHSRF